jgi:hypothetical protein
MTGVVVVRHATFVDLCGQNMTRPSIESEPPKYEPNWATPLCGTMFEYVSTKGSIIPAFEFVFETHTIFPDGKSTPPANPPPPALRT